MEPISLISSSARSIASEGNRSLPVLINSGYSVNAAICNVGFRKSQRIEDIEVTTDLPEPSIWWLFEARLLRVSDVEQHDSIEGKCRCGFRIFLVQSHTPFFGLSKHSTADGVLNVKDGGIDIVNSEWHGFRG